MTKRKALGRGLGALLPGPPQKDPGASSPGLLEVELSALSTGPHQPRVDFREADLARLAESIRQQGVLQPLLVRRSDKSPGYLIIAGERRLRAARMAGLTTVPVTVKEATEAQAFEMALVENLQRQDLNPVEEAQAYDRLINEYGSTQEDVARRVGKDRSTVANSLRLLNLPASVQARLADGALTAGHARALLALKTNAQMEHVVKKILSGGLSVRQTEAMVKSTLSRPSSLRPPARSAGPAVRQLEDRLQRALGTRVRLRDRGKGRGRLEIDYHTLDELDRLLDILLR